MRVPKVIPPLDLLDELSPEELGCLLFNELRKDGDPSIDIIKACIESGADLDVMGPGIIHLNRVTSLVWALFRGPEILRMLIEGGASIYHCDPLKRTLLHYAVSYRQHNSIRFLLDAGIPIDIQDKYEETPLHWAAYNRNLEITQPLLTAGASKWVRNDRGQVPWDVASSTLRYECPELEP